MNIEDANRTNEIKIRSSCGVHLLERDNYCRRCGVRQIRTFAVNHISSQVALK